VLRYNGEMIISELVERFNIVKEYLETLSFSSKEKDKITSECKTF
jgi:coenzyme F420-reducing hydrogenase delta subunit